MTRSVAICPARAAAPPGGIIAAASQCSIATASSTAPRRAKRASSSGYAVAIVSPIPCPSPLRQQIDHQSRDRERKPGDRVLQMIVGERSGGRGALWPAARVGGRIGLDVKRRNTAQPAGGGHGRQIDPEPIAPFG